MVAMFLLRWNRVQDVYTLQEIRIKINKTFVTQESSSYQESSEFKTASPFREAVCEFHYGIIFYASARACCGRDVSAWERDVVGDFHSLYQRQTSAARGPCNQNPGEARV